MNKKLFLTTNPNKLVKFMAIALLFFIAMEPMFAGGTAITNAANTIRSYVSSLKLLIQAVAVIVGIVGGLRIYNKWTNGDQDVNKEIVGWGGAAVFLFVAPLFIEAMFPGA